MTSVPNAIITFPMLGDGFAISASADFSIFGLDLHWYGAIIAIGFLLAVIYISRRSADFGVTSDNIIDLLLFAVPAGIIGARLYYVIFDFSTYKDNLIDIFKIWNGGLAIYGGIIGGIIGAFIFARVKKLPLAPFLDLGGFALLIGQAVGRWGNFINREAFGRETEIFCRMGLTDAAGNTIFVHPTFLYESLWNLLGLLLLHIFSKLGKRRYDGQLFAMYVAWYGIGRLFIEGLRTDSLYLFNTGIRVSQLLAGITVLGAIAFLAINGSRPHDSSKMLVNIKKAEASSLTPEAPSSDPE
ncbi:MAG: prolipoprotein diacylglyceryl transferase [Oscillospiraceae bacterium]